MTRKFLDMKRQINLISGNMKQREYFFKKNISTKKRFCNNYLNSLMKRLSLFDKNLYIFYLKYNLMILICPLLPSHTKKHQKCAKFLIFVCITPSCAFLENLTITKCFFRSLRHFVTAQLLCYKIDARDSLTHGRQLFRRYLHCQWKPFMMFAGVKMAGIGGVF